MDVSHFSGHSPPAFVAHEFSQVKSPWQKQTTRNWFYILACHFSGGSGSSSKKKSSLTTSLSNMMSQLQEVRTGQTTASVPEDDAASFRSDDSGDSEAFVVINQVQCCLLNDFTIHCYTQYSLNIYSVVTFVRIEMESHCDKCKVIIN